MEGERWESPVRPWGGVEQLTWSKDSKTFLQCAPGKAYTHFTVPDSVTTIAYAAFSGCNKLESLTLPFVGASSKFYTGEETLFGYIFGQKNIVYFDNVLFVQE